MFLLEVKVMWQDSKYLKEISRALANINLLQKQRAHPTSQNKFHWLKILNLIVPIFVLSAPYLINRFYRSANVTISDSHKEGDLGIANLIRQVQGEISESENERRENNIAPMFE